MRAGRTGDAARTIPEAVRQGPRAPSRSDGAEVGSERGREEARLSRSFDGRHRLRSRAWRRVFCSDCAGAAARFVQRRGPRIRVVLRAAVRVVENGDAAPPRRHRGGAASFRPASQAAQGLDRCGEGPGGVVRPRPPLSQRPQPLTTLRPLSGLVSPPLSSAPGIAGGTLRSQSGRTPMWMMPWATSRILMLRSRA